MSLVKRGRKCCYHCGNQLVISKGELVFKEYTDPAGNTHQLHKDCFDREGYGAKRITAQPRGATA